MTRQGTPAPESIEKPMALDLPQAELTPAMAAYFQKCEEKIGYVPNVLRAYAHDMAKLEAFAAFYNDLMLAPSGLSKLEREMIAVVVSSETPRQALTILVQMPGFSLATRLSRFLMTCSSCEPLLESTQVSPFSSS